MIKFVSDLRQAMVFSGYSGVLHDIIEVLLKVALNTINQSIGGCFGLFITSINSISIH